MLICLSSKEPPEAALTLTKENKLISLTSLVLLKLKYFFELNLLAAWERLRNFNKGIGCSAGVKGR
jgi:hypothetical protein